MQRKVIYIAEDGTRFDSKDGCLNYESLSDKCERIMSSLFYDKKELDNGNALRHDNDVVKSCFGHFMDLCSTAIPQSRKELQEVKAGKRHISHAQYIIEDYSNDFPCLFKTFFRFMCIDKYGVEYQQPYYAMHRDDFKGALIQCGTYENCDEDVEVEDK